MLRSMTAYGRASADSKLGRFVAEIQSVNRKFLEVNTHLPLEFLRFEPEIKKWIIGKVGRGQVYLKLSVQYDGQMPMRIVPNIPLAKQMKQVCDDIAKAVGLESAVPLTLQMLAGTKELVHYHEQWEEASAYLEVIRQVIFDALSDFLKMKEVEGKALTADIDNRIRKIKECIQEIEGYAPQAVQKHRAKLIERLEEVLPGRIENEERILREICLYAEKIDIAEEIIRFHSHLLQFREVVDSKETCVGKTLEFLLQELGREINTIGSKSNDIQVARLVIEVKSELEKIREQIQNVE